MSKKLINEPKLNLACGQNKVEGFFGIDLVKTEAADIAMDLEWFPWDIESESADEIICSHYVEHTSDLIKFMDEVYRILKPGGKITIVAPYYNSIRCWQDPTHKRAISEMTFMYFNKGWRDMNKLDHYGIKSDFDFCVSPETLVLTSDLKWVRADSVKVDDSIIGVDEFIPGKGLHRRMINSTVEFTRSFEHKRYKLITDSGEIITTPEHPFLTKRNKSNFKWIFCSNLKPGDRIKFVGEPWTEDYSDSWLAGILDGEGCLVLPDVKDRYTGLNLTITQRPGEVLDKSLDILKKEVTDEVGVYNKGKDSGDCKTLCTSGISKAIKILGKYRPIRLLNKFKTILDSGKLGLPKDNATVIAVELLTDGPVIAIRTSTRTLITNGFVSHNTYGYDISTEWATRSQEARDFAMKHYTNVINDIHLVLTKRVIV
jgi:SAM-dependent methyltransferase